MGGIGFGSTRDRLTQSDYMENCHRAVGGTWIEVGLLFKCPKTVTLIRRMQIMRNISIFYILLFSFPKDQIHRDNVSQGLKYSSK